jgi:hypothetical protein
MNNLPHQDHPAEEDLMEFALHALQAGKKEIEDHVRNCEACARTVKEFREVGEQVASLADEEVPQRVEQRVFKLTRHGPVHGHQGPKDKGQGFGVGSLFSNPVFITLLVLLLLLVLYFLVGSEVFKAQ